MTKPDEHKGAIPVVHIEAVKLFKKNTTYLKWGVSLMIHSKLKASLIHFHLIYNVYLSEHVYFRLLRSAVYRQFTGGFTASWA